MQNKINSLVNRVFQGLTVCIQYTKVKSVLKLNEACFILRILGTVPLRQAPGNHVERICKQLSNILDKVHHSELNFAILDN